MEQRLIDLNRFFREKGMSQQDIADKVGRSRQNVTNLLNGKSKFLLKTACLFSDVFGLSPAWLMTGSGEMMGNAQMNFKDCGAHLIKYMESKGITNPEISCKLGIKKSFAIPWR